MIDRSTVIFGFVAAVLPFIVYSFVRDLTKQQFLILAVITLLIGIMASTAIGRLILNWLGQSEHLVPIIFAMAALIISLSIVRLVAIRRRRYRMTWPRRPPQREFSAACYDRLTRTGWTYRQDINRISFNVYWMQREKERLTFIFSANRLELDDLQRSFSSTGLTPGKEVLVVFWDRPVDTMQVALEKRGWRLMVIDEFKQSDANLKDHLTAVGQPPVGASTTDSWASLRAQ